jgi:hypothetical protein
MSTMRKTEVHLTPTGETTPKQVTFHNTWGVDGQGQFAMELMKSALQGTRSMDALDTVNLCATMAEMALAEFERRGWLIEIPTWDELNSDAPGKAGF